MFLFGDEFIIPGYHRVTFKDSSILENHYKELDDCLYLHSLSGPAGYWNSGNYELYINDKEPIIPIIKKFKTNPRYYITAPAYDIDAVYDIYCKLEKLSSFPVVIQEVDKKFADSFINKYTTFKKSVAGKEFVYDADKNSKLNGHEFSDMRYRIKKFLKFYPNYEIRELTSNNVDDVILMLNKWNETQGKKYFRATIGRDKRFLKEFADSPNMWCNVLYINGECVGYCSLEKAFKDNHSILVSAKALPQYCEAGYFLWHKTFEDAVKHNCTIVNAAGSYGKGVYEQKNRWKPIKLVPTFNLERKK